MNEDFSRRPLDVLKIPLSGQHLIEASAGTGKTYTITSLIVRLIAERELQIQDIVAVTFTNAATSELKDRVAGRLLLARDVVRGDHDPVGDPLLESLLVMPDQARIEKLLSRAVIEVDRAGIFTIHAFAARMLKEHSFESGAREGSELSGDPRPVVHDVVTDFWSSRVATLNESEFRAVGGSSFYKILRHVGIQAAGAPELPLVQPIEVDREAAQARLKAQYELVRVVFFREGEGLLHRLIQEPGLNRNQMSVVGLHRDYAHYRSYFELGEPSRGHPDSERFTQAKVVVATKKNATALTDPLLVLLGELREAYLEAQRADSFFADSLRFALCQEIHGRIRDELLRTGTQSFDGILLDLARALRDPQRGPGLALDIRRDFPVALIDEFQDTDPLQYEIFSRIYANSGALGEGHSSLYLIGDPKQSIYAFRGADIRTYLAAATGAGATVWTLSTSYRASPSLVRAQNELFNGARKPFGTDQIIYDEVSPRPSAVDELFDAGGVALPGIQLLEYSGTARETPSAIAREVAAFLQAGPTLSGRAVTPGDIAVLTRTNRQAALVQEELQLLQIPAVLHGDRSVFEAPEALELRRVLRALAEPTHRGLFRTALSTRTLGLGAQELQRLDDERDELERFSQLFRDWGDLWRRRGVASAISALHSTVQFQARTLSAIDGERRMTNFRHLMELLHEAESREHLGVSGLLRWLDSAVFDPDSHGMADEARQLRLESDADAVTLTTAHRSKGLEYNVVFLPSLSESERKGDRAEAFRYFDAGAQESRFEMRARENRADSNEQRRREGQEEALRLAYVALTRAKHHVVVFCAEAKSFSALGYFLHEAQAPEADTEAVGHYLSRLDSCERRRQLEDRCVRSGGTLRLTEVHDAQALPYARPRDTTEIVEPEAIPLLLESERTNSFSSMTRDAHHRLSRAAREGHDVDEALTIQNSPEINREPIDPQLTPCTLENFPRGAGPGDALHAAFEHCGFAESKSEERREVVSHELSKRGFSQEHIEALQKNIEEVLLVPLALNNSPVQIAPCALGSLGTSKRVAEMEFNFAVGSSSHRLSAARLARALGYEEDESVIAAARPGGEGLLGQAYLSTVHRLPFSAWCGFLRGFMDLVFEHEGRLYGVDYKSNYLGAHFEDYTPSALRTAMEEHHYFLQALFYATAIHRYGKSRIVGYSYEEHFGGMHYLFVRGMHPEHGQSGVFSFRPERELIESLELALAAEWIPVPTVGAA